MEKYHSIRYKKRSFLYSSLLPFSGLSSSSDYLYTSLSALMRPLLLSPCLILLSCGLCCSLPVSFCSHAASAALSLSHSALMGFATPIITSVSWPLLLPCLSRSHLLQCNLIPSCSQSLWCCSQSQCCSFLWIRRSPHGFCFFYGLCCSHICCSLRVSAALLMTFAALSEPLLLL